MNSIKNKSCITSFWVSFLYVGIGTLCLFLMPLNSLFVTIVNILTMPAIFIGFGILYGGGINNWPLVLLAQLIIFFCFWLLIYRVILSRDIKKNKENE